MADMRRADNAWQTRAPPDSAYQTSCWRLAIAHHESTSTTLWLFCEAARPMLLLSGARWRRSAISIVTNQATRIPICLIQKLLLPSWVRAHSPSSASIEHRIGRLWIICEKSTITGLGKLDLLLTGKADGSCYQILRYRLEHRS